MNFFRISRQIPEKRDVWRFFNQICRKFWILWKKNHYYNSSIQNYSLHSLGCIGHRNAAEQAALAADLGPIVAAAAEWHKDVLPADSADAVLVWKENHRVARWHA